MNLNISWTPPVIAPTCDYKLHYRRNEDLAYTSVDVTSGTSQTVAILAPACYEGYVQSNCCADGLSDNTPFGVNAYSFFELEAVNSDLGYFNLNVTSEYGNSYDTIISGTINYTVKTVPFTQLFTVTYSASTTSDTFNLTEIDLPTDAIVTDISDVTYSPVFDNGGSLQQYDAVNTPSYFKYLLSGTTIPAYNGSPASLPSFILNDFIITEVDTSGNTLAGNLLISWVQDSVYSSGTSSPYNTVTLIVSDTDLYDSILGSITVLPEPIGLRSIVLPLVKATFALNSSTHLYIKAQWADGTVIDTHHFRLP